MSSNARTLKKYFSHLYWHTWCMRTFLGLHQIDPIPSAGQRHLTEPSIFYQIDRKRCFAVVIRRGTAVV